ncbi:epididymal-specific lipocalin-12 [Myotis daubentonii]|uniref:epididymal-specific lipocalin-12 n=1 Tax=Myotis daubentonii TaxID=98922 RepID=UPI002873B521|nr:epididymal-specific lipocalin-12 [Myotis daubentonii]
MGPLCALWVLLALLEAMTPPPKFWPTTIQIMQGFEVDKFQGEWFVLGLAGSTHSRADRSLLSPFTATFEKNKTNQLEVTYAMIRGQRCVTWSYVLIPTAQPGVFSVEKSRELGTDTEEVWVHETDYGTFALTSSRRRSSHRSILRVHLLFRAWALQTEALGKFLCLLTARGLSEANIVFPDIPDWARYRKTCGKTK